VTFIRRLLQIGFDSSSYYNGSKHTSGAMAAILAIATRLG